MVKNRKFSYIASLVLFSVSRVAAQSITGTGGGGFLGSTVGNYFDLSGGPPELFYDAIAFLFVWVFAYAMGAVVLHFIAEYGPGGAGKKFKQVILGEDGSLTGHNGGRNLLIILSFLGILLLGEHLGPLLDDVQAIVMGLTGSVFILVIIGIVLGLILAVGYGLGLFGQGAAATGNSMATGASAVASSAPVKWGKEKGKGFADQVRKANYNIAGGTNSLIKAYANIGNNLGYLVCPKCGKIHDTSRNGETCGADLGSSGNCSETLPS